MAAKSASEGVESASMKMSHSPLAARAPASRARPIWLTGSKTTRAPAARPSSAVRSVELLSHTKHSQSQPRAVNADAAAFTAASAAGRSFSSLKAGRTTETRITGGARQLTCSKAQAAAPTTPTLPPRPAGTIEQTADRRGKA